MVSNRSRSVCRTLAVIGCATLGSCAALSKVVPEQLTQFSADALVGATATGSCGYGAINPNGSVAAISSKSAVLAGLQNSGCGTCLQITCRDQTVCFPNAIPVVVTVIDSCPGCVLNIPTPLFADLTEPSAGGVAVQVQQVDCLWAGNITVRVQEYRTEGGGFIKVAPWNIAGSGLLKSLEVKGFGTPERTWQKMENTYGAVWQASRLPTPPLDVRLTNSRNESIVALGALIGGATGDIPTQVQFKIPAVPST